MIRQSLLLAACALAPFVFTGCADDATGDKSAETAPVSVASPAPDAETFGKDLATFATRIRTADAAFERVVGDSATDPEDRIAAFNKSIAALGTTTATTLGAKLKSDGVAVGAGWDASFNTASDPEMRTVVAAGRDESKARFAELDKALGGADASIIYHTGILRNVQAALGPRPNASQLVAARSVSNRATEAGNKAVGWLNYTAAVAKKAGAAPLPVAVNPASKATPAEVAPEAPVPTPAAPVVTPASEPAIRIFPPAVTPLPAVTPPPVITPPPAAAPSPKPIESVEPKPVARPDPVPEPVDA